MHRNSGAFCIFERKSHDTKNRTYLFMGLLALGLILSIYATYLHYSAAEDYNKKKEELSSSFEEIKQRCLRLQNEKFMLEIELEDLRVQLEDCE